MKENPTTTQNKIAPHGAILLISKRNLCLLLVRPHVLTTCTALGAAIETGMRSGEMLALTWPNVNFEKRTAFLPGTKNGNPRTVPLSTRALNAIHALPKSINGRLFTRAITVSKRISLALTKAQAAQTESQTFLKGLRFHDLRHEAVTRLFEKGLNPIEVGMVSGHKTLSMLQRYTHLRSEGLMAKLDENFSTSDHRLGTR